MKSKLNLFRIIHTDMEMHTATISLCGIRDAIICPALWEGRSTNWLTVRDVGGAEGLVRETISWIANRSFKRCRGLLIPISLWISVSDRADMMAPLFTLARQAATYQAGIPSQSCWIENIHIDYNHNWHFSFSYRPGIILSTQHLWTLLLPPSHVIDAIIIFPKGDRCTGMLNNLFKNTR